MSEQGPIIRERRDHRPDGRKRYLPTDFGDRPWQALLTFGLARADAFGCLLPYRYVQQDFFGAPLGSALLEPFADRVLERYASFVRAGHLGDTAVQVLRLRLSDELAAALRSVRRLEDWRFERGRPEDPTLALRGRPILETDSRSGQVSVYATREELEHLADEGVRLIEPLGVKAAPWPTP